MTENFKPESLPEIPNQETLDALADKGDTLLEDTQNNFTASESVEDVTALETQLKNAKEDRDALNHKVHELEQLLEKARRVADQIVTPDSEL